MVHLIFEKSDAFFQQLNQNIATDCSEQFYAHTHLQTNGVHRMYSTCTYNRQTICCYFLVELIKKNILSLQKKTVIDLPRQVIFLSCSAFFAWYFCCSSLSWNKTISSFSTRYWGHTWSRSKIRVFNLLSEVFSTLSQ